VTQNIATINFVYDQNGVLIYPDMVKVRVNLDNGKVEGFEGLSFIANHKDRQITNIDVNVSDELLPNGCSVERTALAIIPTDGGDERLCIEVRCKVDGDDFVLYFDPETFDEVKIFKVIHTENSDFAV
jgi:germination protein YpeB